MSLESSPSLPGFAAAYSDPWPFAAYWGAAAVGTAAAWGAAAETAAAEVAVAAVPSEEPG